MIDSTTAKRFASFSLGLASLGALVVALVGYWRVVSGMIVTVATALGTPPLGF